MDLQRKAFKEELMRRALLILGCLMVVVALAGGCCPKVKIPPQPPILPPPEAIAPKVEPTPTPTPLPPENQEPKARSAALKPIHFDFNQFAIRPGDAQIMDGNVAWLKANAQAKVTVAGYCDPVGTEEYNRGLGMRRAGAARNYLTSHGIDAGRVSALSFGEEHLVTTNPKEFELNRRVEFEAK
jgi:peptidoglycan-associated lipoprotein